MMIPMPWKISRFAKDVDSIDAVWKLVYESIEHIGDKYDHMPMLDDYWQYPEETLSLMKGDCEDKVILALAICNLKRIPARMIGGVIESSAKYGHAWLETRGGRRVEDHLENFTYIKSWDAYLATSILKVAKSQEWPWYYRLVWRVWLWFTGL